MNEKFLINNDDDVYPRQKFHRAVYINDNSICKMDSDKTDPVSCVEVYCTKYLQCFKFLKTLVKVLTSVVKNQSCLT